MRSPSRLALIHRAAPPPDIVRFPDFVGEVAAHHNADQDDVKYKLWCKMWARAPRSCRDWQGRRGRRFRNTEASANPPKKKTPANKKRPELLRVMGRPNSPPPGLLTEKTTTHRQNCTFHLRANHVAQTGHMTLPWPDLTLSPDVRSQKLQSWLEARSY